MTKQKILPIAIDLGAKNTGVFSALYDKGTELTSITTKQGRVYHLAEYAYTLLMTNRTSKRHARRGIDRKQLVKRLFKLIWTKSLNLQWDNDIQQTTSFLLNRRGFSFLQEHYDPEYLSSFPKECYDNYLQDIVTIETNGTDEPVDLDEYLQTATEKGELENIYAKIQAKIELANKIKVIESLQLAITSKLANKAIKDKSLSKVNTLIAAELISPEKIKPHASKDTANLVAYVQQAEEQALLELQHQLSSTVINDADQIWELTIENFDLEKNEEKLDAEYYLVENKKEGTEAKIDKKKKKEYIKTHLHHFAFAAHKIYDELNKGSRHRSKYFEEIVAVLEETKHKEKYLRTFCTSLSQGRYLPLDKNKLHNLLANLSNLEFKPLRKYFNDKAHSQADYWDEQRFAHIYCRWILSEWRVGEKDKEKRQGKAACYKTLCAEIKNTLGTTQEIKTNAIKGSVIDFLYQLDPKRSIPPYQDNNNRKPPKCQSLLLNANFLTKQYPKWQEYLQQLTELHDVKEYLANFKQTLIDLKTSKQKQYFIQDISSDKKIASGQRNYAQLDARVLQFIFDRVKKEDGLKLNEIYSYAKKAKQNASSSDEKQAALGKLNEAIKNSTLPSILKTSHQAGVFSGGSFLHLVCKYFKARQRARDSRLYLMPEYRQDKKTHAWKDTGRFEDNHQLLSLCNHKPRQKRYQTLYDLAGVLQVSPKLLADKLQGNENTDIDSSDEGIEKWLKSFYGLAANCKNSLEMQQLYRGTLNSQIKKVKFKNTIINLKKNKQPTEQEQHTINKYTDIKKLTTKENDLLKLLENINKTSFKIGKFLDLAEGNSDKFNSIYSFAQIQQIVFTERNGNANTCPVCSADNAQRMQIANNTAKAQRLAAIPTRVIDGAVKKMANIVTKAIVEDNWHNIQTALTHKHKIHIPIITESNQFEFEPQLAKAKGKNIKKKRAEALKKINPEAVIKDKAERIKIAAGSISAYSGNHLTAPTELDHIIPRSHPKYGTLNDEANLICVNQEDNQNRGNTIYYLNNLAANYKQKIFNTTDNANIENQIIESIWNTETGEFKFGKYLSFINLKEDEQTAFRHALFLADDHPLKQAVIRAIDNRNRTFVNGTQRYFAQVLANNIYLRATKEKLDTNHISFDYFAIATTNAQGRGIAQIRQFLEQKYSSELNKFKKPKATESEKSKDNIATQHSYSHLIDAMLAFSVAADEHRNDGSLGLQIADKYSLFPAPEIIDTTTGEILASDKDDIFSHIQVRESAMQEQALKRVAPTDGYNLHKQLAKDGIYAEHYLAILVHKNKDEVRKGFNWKNSEQITLYKGKKYDQEVLNSIIYALKFMATPINMEKQVANLDDIKQILLTHKVADTADYYYIDLKTQKLHEYYIANYNTALGYKAPSVQMQFLRTLAYRTEMEKITSIEDVKNVVKNKKFAVGKVELPVKQEWRNLLTKWQNNSSEDDHDFLTSYFKINQSAKQHKKVSKAFSLPIKTNLGNYLIKRKGWDNTVVYQILDKSDPRKDGTQAFIPTFNTKKQIKTKGIIDTFTSKNIFILKDEYFDCLNGDSVKKVDKTVWFAVKIPNDLLEIGIKEISYRMDDNTRPSVKICYSNIALSELDLIMEHKLLKPNMNGKTEEKKEDFKSNFTLNAHQKHSITYKHSGFNKNIEELLNPALVSYYETSSS